MAVLGPGERSARSRQARSAAEDGGRRLFCFARNAAPSRQGKKAGVAVAGRRSRRSRPSGLIRPFEVAWDAPIKQTDGDHHDCRHRRRTRTRYRRSHKDLRVRIDERRRRDPRTMEYDFASQLGRAAAPSIRGHRVRLAISMSQITDWAAPIYASLVTCEGDDGSTLIHTWT